MGAPWNQGVSEVEAAIEAVSAFLKDLPATPEAGRCRRALARCRSRDGGPPSDRWKIILEVREDLRMLGFTGRLP